MNREIIMFICLSCLIFQSMVWFVTDPRSHSKKFQQTFDPHRMAFFIKASIFISIYLLTSIYLSWPSTSKDNAWVAFGLIIYLIGTTLAIWARFNMNRYWGIPAQHDAKNQSVLITGGAFSYSRNPIYVSVLLLFIGTSIALRSYSIVLVPVVWYVIYQTVLIEEGLLLKTFGKEYADYKARVPRFL